MKVNNKFVTGGIPYTGVGDWLRENDPADHALIVTKIAKDGFVSQKIFQKAVVELAKFYPKVAVSGYELLSTFYPSGFSKLDRADQEKIIGEIFNRAVHDKGIKEAGFKTKIQIFFFVDAEGNHSVAFRREKLASSAFFREFIQKFQHCYNLILVGKNSREIQKELREMLIYTPFNSYPEQQGCILSSLQEKMQAESKIQITKNLLAAASSICLPNYGIYANYPLRRVNNISNGLINNGYAKTLGFSIRNAYFKNKREAIDYCGKWKDENKTFILIGNICYLHFLQKYKNYKLLEGKNFITLDTYAVFSFPFGKNPLAYFPDKHFFGRMRGDDFSGFWKGAANEEKLKKLLIFPGERRFSVLEVDFIDKGIKYLERQGVMGKLIQLLALNAATFFSNKVVIIDKSMASEQKIYFGRQAIQKFRDELMEGLAGKNVLSDDVVFYVVKELEKTFLFLADIIQEISEKQADFRKEEKKSRRMIKLLLEMEAILAKDGLEKANYVFPGYTHEFKKTMFLSDRSKKQLINLLEEILLMQDDLFVSLREKLKKIDKKAI